MAFVTTAIARGAQRSVDKGSVAPFAHGQWLAAHVPGATSRLQQGEGHLSVGVGGLDRMFDDLLTTISD